MTTRDTEPASLAKVVVVHSIWDAITARRIGRIAQDTRARDYTVEHLYPLTVRDGDPVMDEPDFEARLIGAIERTRATCVVVHTGLAFTLHRDVYRRVLPRVAARFPALVFLPDRAGQMEAAGLHLPTVRGPHAARLLDILF